MRAVVAGDEDDGVLGDAQRAQPVGDLPDERVEVGGLGGVALVLLGPGAGGVGADVGDVARGVRHGRREEEQEGLGGVVTDEVQCALFDELGA